MLCSISSFLPLLCKRCVVKCVHDFRWVCHKFSRFRFCYTRLLPTTAACYIAQPQRYLRNVFAVLESLHWLGVSFGLTSSLFAFWSRNKMSPVYLRQTANSLTGEHTTIMLKVRSSDNKSASMQNFYRVTRGGRVCDLHRDLYFIFYLWTRVAWSLLYRMGCAHVGWERDGSELECDRIARHILWQRQRAATAFCNIWFHCALSFFTHPHSAATTVLTGTRAHHLSKQLFA